MIAISFLILAVSCNQTEKEFQNDDIVASCEQDAYDDLLLQLDEYNAQFNIETKVNEKGRFWKRLGWITLCDLSGFAIVTALSKNPILGLFGGAISSISAFVGVYDNTKSIDLVLPVNLGTENLYSSYENFCDSAGFWHNKIIRDIYERDTTCFATYSEEQFYSAAEELFKVYFPDVSLPIGINENLIQISTLMESLNDKSIDETFDTISLLYPEIASELSVIQVYCEAINELETEDDLSNYSVGFRQLVLDSNIPDSSKENIQGSVSVAGSSKILWMDSCPQLAP